MKRERETKILDLLTSRGRMEVTELSGILGVSQVTVRKDLDRLEEKHMVRRVHGFAELNSADDINGRLAYHYEQKMKIAAKAAELVMETDYRIKTSFDDADRLLELLILQLAQEARRD